MTYYCQFLQQFLHHASKSALICCISKRHRKTYGINNKIDIQLQSSFIYKEVKVLVFSAKMYTFVQMRNLMIDEAQLSLPFLTIRLMYFQHLLI